MKRAAVAYINRYGFKVITYHGDDADLRLRIAELNAQGYAPEVSFEELPDEDRPTAQERPLLPMPSDRKSKRSYRKPWVDPRPPLEVGKRPARLPQKEAA